MHVILNNWSITDRWILVWNTNTGVVPVLSTSKSPDGIQSGGPASISLPVRQSRFGPSISANNVYNFLAPTIVEESSV